MKSLSGFFSRPLYLLIIACIFLMSQFLLHAENPDTEKQSPVGRWKSIDLVTNVSDFQPGKSFSKVDLYLKEFQFKPDGKASMGWTWKKDVVTHMDGKTSGNFFIRKINGKIYLFLPWLLSGSRKEKGKKPAYYVLEKVSDKILPDSQIDLVNTSKDAGRRISGRKAQHIKSLSKFQDVRIKDISGLDFSGRPDLPISLKFDEETIWPDSDKLPKDCDPKKILRDGMNPGLGVRSLHKQGITGKGVTVAIIDQPLLTDHPEYKGKIAAYHDEGCGNARSMHGPAVASLLVGENCGTAPDAKLIYVAAPFWKSDAAYVAEALEWLIEQNNNLPDEKKIRVVSVSGSPSGPGSRFKKNQEMWDKACNRAEKAGMMVLDCTSHRGFIGRCYYDLSDPDDLSLCKAGSPQDPGAYGTQYLYVPSSRRTVAEEDSGRNFAYCYYGVGGLSWSIPYCAGVLAMGWQVNPDISPDKMKELLFKSAFTGKEGAKIINPKNFIKMVKDSSTE